MGIENGVIDSAYSCEFNISVIAFLRVSLVGHDLEVWFLQGIWHFWIGSDVEVVAGRWALGEGDLVVLGIVGANYHLYGWIDCQFYCALCVYMQKE